MKKYFGWIFALVTCLTMISAYADEPRNGVAEENDDEELAVIIDDDDLDLDDQGEE